MMKYITKSILSVSILILFISCSKDKQTQKEYLSSWNEGKSKSAIVEFVAKVTDKNSGAFVRPSERVAVFDNDGTLWSEQPLYFQLFFTLDRLKQLVDENPEWKEDEMFKAALDNNMEKVFSYGEHGLIKLVMATHAGISTDEFETVVKEWVRTAKHPRFNKPFTSLVYQPMLELLEYLRANEFKTFIVSGGGLEFMRPLTEELYGIPPEQVIGSSLVTKFEILDGNPQITQLPEMGFVDDKEGKPVAINKHIGRKPIAAFGNSDGDLQMLQWTASNNPSFMLYVHHTDSEREWAYDRDSHIGKFDKGLDEAREKGWTIVDMKNDWKVIYPLELRN